MSPRRITLPSGRAITVTEDYLIPDADALRSLNECRACQSRLVQPVGQEALPGGSCYMLLACPDCGHRRSGTFTQDDADALEDEGLAGMLASLQRMIRANLEYDGDDIARFTAALHADMILPEDF